MTRPTSRRRYRVSGRRGTVLDVTRLPGGPLLTEEDAAELIGRTIQVVVVGTGDFPTELQLSPAAYQRIAPRLRADHRSPDHRRERSSVGAPVPARRGGRRRRRRRSQGADTEGDRP